ncbi:MAG: DUF2225 domain-containing protein [Desulfotomaculum sp.]|nr:DUF2225 domain-containing protein [Desulfotomaculum sp.]
MDLNVKLQLLKKSALFKNFSDNTLKTIVNNTEIITCQQDTMLYKEGDYGDSFYVVALGRVTLYKKVENGTVIPIFTVNKGEHFGEMAYFNKSGIRTLSAKAHAKSVLFKIPHAFLVLIQQNSAISYSLIKAMQDRQKKVYTKLAAVSAQSADNKGTGKSEEKKEKKDSRENNTGSKSKIIIDESLLTKHIQETLNPVKQGEAKNSVKDEEENSGEIPEQEMLYEKKLTCPVCQKKFSTPRPLSKYIRISQTDSDFCNHYEGLNPIFYEVAVCPKCNYAFTDDTPDKLGPTALKNISDVLENLPKKDYSTTRDIDTAVETYILAILCQTAYENRDSIIARLYLRMAWLYRYKKNIEKEKTYLQMALEKYLSAFNKEKFEPKTELQLTYLVGELYNRLGDPKNAIQWFSSLVMHPKKDQYPAIVHKAREQWQDLREKMKSSRRE